ncbi:MAG: NAD(P)-dependent oxidoreductase [Lachnospiraceae bacterium]|nr:NAD(P)-dependent oxidoreductase [Lachnospiraceae bacterium]
MKVVVTGATGFVGKWLVNELLSQRDDVTIIVGDIKKVPEEWKNVLDIVEASLEQISGLNPADFPQREAEILFHLAWRGVSGKERADNEIQLENVQFTCDTVRLAEKLHCRRFVHAGSIMEYEAIKYIPTVNAEPGVGNIYSIAKLTADLMAKTIAVNAGMEYINLIISNIYGAGEHSERFFNTTLKKMMNHQPIPLTHGRQLYDFIYASDAVRAMILAGKKGEKNSEYYIGNTRQYPLKEFVLQMKETLESQSELLFGQVPLKTAMLTYHEFDTARIETLGFKPEVDFVQGIKMTKEWMMEERSGGKK